MTPDCTRRELTHHARPHRAAFATLIGALALGSVTAPSRPARADEPPPEGGDVQAKIEAKMKEILRLMRENGQAILEASKGGTEKPKGVTVTPPEPPRSDGATPPPDGPSGGMDGGMAGGSTGTEPGAGGEIRRRMEEIVEQANKTGAAIPRELEELVRMIPKKKSGPPSDGPPPPDSESRKPGDKPNPGDGDPKKKDGKDDPKPGERDPKNRGDKPPPDGENGRPREDDTPPWIAELPAEVRRSVLNADPAKVPPEYRDLLIRYQKWLLERAAKAKDGR